MHNWYQLEDGTLINLDLIRIVYRGHGKEYKISFSSSEGDDFSIGVIDYTEIFNILFGVEK